MISHKDIFGWFETSIENFYTFIAESLKDDSHIVEIGCFMGQSTCFMAQKLKTLNKKIKFDVIDNFIGSAEHKDFLKDKSLYDTFINNMKKAEVFDYLNIIKSDSAEASKLYANNSLDFVFIDAGHDYDSVKADISAWLPKIKSGGILSGDDYLKCHPGVIQAVNESLKNFTIFSGKRIWMYKI